MLKFGDVLRPLMKQRGMSLEDIAGKTDIGISKMYLIVYGTQEPTLLETRRIAVAIGVSIDYLCWMREGGD